MSSNKLGQILITDDEAELKNVLVETLNAQGFEATGYTSGKEALSALRGRNFDVLLSDLMMPEMDGITLLRDALEVDQHLICIIMTGQGTIQTAVDAMKVGAFDYVLKPFRLQAILPVLSRAVNVRRLRQENLQLRETVAIHELCQTIASTLDPQTVLNKLADAALQQSEADEVSVLLPTDDGSELYVAAVRGANRERLLGERVPLEQSIASWVARERTPILLEGQVNDARFTALWPRPDIRSAISVPLQLAGKLIGILNINATSRARPFTPGQMKALTILASTAAAALESASLYGQVRQAEEKYRSIFENTVEGIFQSTPDGRFITVNPSMARILGYESPEEMVATVTDITHQLYVDPERRGEAARIQEERGILQGLEFEAYRKDGEKIWLSLNRRSVRDENGAELYREGSVEDITERMRAAEELRVSEKRYRDLVENARDLIYSHDLEGNYTSINKAGEQITGYTREESLSMNIAQTVAPEYLEKARRMIVGKLTGEEVTAYELEIIAKDGRRIPVEVNTRLVYQAGVPCGVQGIARDITDRRELEDQLRQSQKLEAVGQLAGGVAHDFNNMLTVINGYSDLLLRGLGQDDPMHSKVEEIKKAGERASSLTRQLLAFSRKQVLQPKVLQLRSVVADVDKMLRRLIGEDIDLLTVLAPELGSIKADPGQIEQVVMNLAVNARDAMPQGGKLTIEAENVYLDGEYVSHHITAAPGPYVMLAVSDTGVGMDEKTKARIFEPFFTTKEVGRGTGLGLSTVYGIVKQSGGNIWVYSEVGKGTTFKIYLPRVDGVVDSDSTRNATAELPRGHETVLLAEDEEQVRRMTRTILEMNGYRVLEASSGDEALATYKQHEGRIDLVITDVVMPQMSGRELAQSLEALRPGIKVLYVSGYTDDAIVRHGLLDAGIAFIQKPFTPEALSRKVREVLDAAPEN
jgi:PAS domain S-box-containing protein